MLKLSHRCQWEPLQAVLLSDPSSLWYLPLLSGMIRYSKFILYISCTKSGMSHFYRKPWFLLVRKGTRRPNTGCLQCTHLHLQIERMSSACPGPWRDSNRSPDVFLCHLQPGTASPICGSDPGQLLEDSQFWAAPAEAETFFNNQSQKHFQVTLQLTIKIQLPRTLTPW